MAQETPTDINRDWVSPEDILQEKEFLNFPDKSRDQKPVPSLAYEEKDTAHLGALDKITGQTKTFGVQIGQTIKFGSIYIMPRACRKTPPIEPPESAAFLQIWEINPDKDPIWLFSNWMFASDPAISTIDHPVYDIWVLDCKNADISSSSEEKKPALPAITDNAEEEEKSSNP